MGKHVVFYSRADENYFGGQYRFVKAGNTEKVAQMVGDATTIGAICPWQPALF